MSKNRSRRTSRGFAVRGAGACALVASVLLAGCGEADSSVGGTTAGLPFANSGATATGGATATATAGTPGTNGAQNGGATADPAPGTTAGAATGTTAGTTTGSAGLGDGGAGAGAEGGTGYQSSVEPIIPQVSGDCPDFASGSFSFSGLQGEMEVGSKGSGSGSLLFYWHGTGGSAGDFGGLFAGIGSGNIQKITSAGGIVFSVQGASGSGDSSCSGTAVFDGDFSVIDQVVACAVRDHNIDPHRIYATGCSAGGLQSGCMATRRSDYVAAVAPNSGGLVSAFGASLSGTSGHVPSSMTMHGGADDNVGINFGTSSASFNDLITSEGGFAIDCNHMSGHCGAPGDLYDAAIDFLLAHPFGVEPTPYTSGLPGSFPAYCQIQ